MIEVEHLSLERAGHFILKEVGFTVRNGEFVGIIGPNGAGKSTLLKIIVGEITEYTGTVKTQGRIGYIPQRKEFQRDFPIKAKEVVAMGLYKRRGLFHFFTRNDWVESRTLLERVGIADLADERVAFFSGGEFQRLMLARAMAFDPDILILDEPEAGIDEMGKASFQELLESWKNEGKRSVLLVSHDIGLVLQSCDTVLCLNKSLHCHKNANTISSEDLRSVYTDEYDILIKGKNHFEKEHKC